MPCSCELRQGHPDASRLGGPVNALLDVLAKLLHFLIGELARRLRRTEWTFLEFTRCPLAVVLSAARDAIALLAVRIGLACVKGIQAFGLPTT